MHSAWRHIRQIWRATGCTIRKKSRKKLRKWGNSSVEKNYRLAFWSAKKERDSWRKRPQVVWICLRCTAGQGRDIPYHCHTWHRNGELAGDASLFIALYCSKAVCRRNSFRKSRELHDCFQYPCPSMQSVSGIWPNCDVANADYMACRSWIHICYGTGGCQQQETGCEREESLWDAREGNFSDWMCDSRCFFCDRIFPDRKGAYGSAYCFGVRFDIGLDQNFFWQRVRGN